MGGKYNPKMPNGNEKAHREDVLQSAREEESRKVREGLPVPAATLKGIFTYVDRCLAENDCDNTLRYVRDFIHSHNLPEDALVAWLEENHGYCDCEAIMNSEEVVQDAVPGYEDIEPDA